ncbi:protein of unknown function [Bradyrhizobium sp. ORS 285]|uniref:hypothetical protein n=1 Tax=Bradyrhizobium sp. ORS 285 TaxID=115808 RepID=UPI00024095AD|nr:hypothetical protein [Bradyrhizobium sp. ORS 285]CCD89873.1 hypothetical protein BRAO285_850079 [Bradyrhizobium sp. ORS 285]SMX61502.1 protein of unknown function [Bradyrhizobium sp. ORS 285]
MATKTIKKPKKKTEGNTHWKNLFEYEYLGSHNLMPDEELVGEISKIVEEEIGRKVRKKGEKDKEILPVIYFKEAAVPKMVLNKTNAATISKLYGPYTDKWIGKRIQIFSAEVNAFGEKVTALRVRDSIPADTAPAPVTNELKQMRACKTLRDLQAYFVALPNEKKAHPDILALKEELKTTLK